MGDFGGPDFGGPDFGLGAPPLPPTGLGVTVSSTEIDLFWTASVGATSYTITRNGVLVGTSAGTFFADIGLIPNTVYSYAVTAVGVNGSSSPATITARTNTIPPPPPLGILLGRILPIVEARADYVTVAFSAASGYTEIQVPTSALPSTPTPGPTMLVRFNLDGTYTLYRPLPQPRPVFGNQITNQLPASPNGTTEVVVPQFI
jgi:hypothetical protein